MRCYVFDSERRANRAEREIAQTAGCPYNDGKRVRRKGRRASDKVRQDRQETTGFSTVKPRKDGKYYLFIPEGLDPNSPFANIPLLDESRHKYVIETFKHDWWPDPEPIKTMGIGS